MGNKRELRIESTYIVANKNRACGVRTGVEGDALCMRDKDKRERVSMRASDSRAETLHAKIMA
jgi:hypothetical protein